MKERLNYLRFRKILPIGLKSGIFMWGLLIVQFLAINNSIAATTKAIQQLSISGTVTDASSGEALPGVNVVIVGTTNGVITDMNGKYSIEVPNQDAILVFSFMGYLSEKISVQGKTQIDVNLISDIKNLDEVIVVGYGTNNKKTLTGSVAQVKGDDVLKGKATQNIAVGLQGSIPGLTVTRTSSRPGNEDAKITLRGGISVNETNVMILIDGVEASQMELSQINPGDVESVSVLKDAAAAIYGTKAGAGVMLITTKRGKQGKTKVTYSGSSHINILGKKFPVADGQTWAQMLIHATDNDAYALLNAQGQPQYSWWMWSETAWRAMAEGKVYEAVENGRWRHLDPNVNQFDLVYGNTWGQSHNFTIGGGTENLSVMTSFGFADDRSLCKVVYDGQKKYNFRTNADYKVNSWIKSELNISYDNRNTSTPSQGVGHGIQDFYVFPMYNPYGQYYDTFGSNNILAKLNEGGRTNNTEEILRLGGKLTLDLGKITRGLSIYGSANTRIRKHKIIARQTQITMYDWSGETVGSTNAPDYTRTSGVISKVSGANDKWVKNTNEDEFYQVYNAFVTYKRGFADHNIGVLAGMTAEKNRYNKYYAFRSNMASDELDDINTGDKTTQLNEGGSNHEGLVSYLGRLNYDYRGIYLLEGLFRRDGSSKFDADHRWSNFAGISGGIRVSEFSFIQNLDVFNNLKLRGSYGETGSQTGIGRYDYISGITTGTTVFGYNGTYANTSWVTAMTSNLRSWERVVTTNYAIDFTVLHNRLSGTFELYKRENIGMLISMIYPMTLGTKAPTTNDGNFVAKGWELSLNWDDKIGKDFSYRVGVTLEDSRTEITEYAGAVSISDGVNNTVGGSSFIVNKPLNALYVYKTDGYLQNTDEVNTYYTEITKLAGGLHPVQGTTNQLTPGCVRKVDMSGDGRITQDDRYYYGDANPHYMFGLNLSAKYKAIDFSMFIQGVGQQYILRTGSLSSPWNTGWTNQNATFWGNTWTPENTNAPYPVMSRNGARNNWNYKQFNDINISNSWYARAKSVVLGYTLPKMWLQKANIESLRVFVSGDNLFEISNVKDGFDPETRANSSQGNVDVFARTISFGVDLTF